MSSCQLCGESASLGVNVLVSTRGVRPRAQKCSHSVLFCGECVKQVSNEAGPVTFAGLLEALRETYTAIAERSAQSFEGAR
jgi:hypothetical protein